VAVLNSCLTLVFFAFLLGPLNDSYFSQYWSPLSLVFFIVIKFLLYGGILGSLVELASGEELVLRLKNFKKNVIQFWPLYAIVIWAPFLIVFPMSFFFSDISRLLPSHLNLPLLFFLAWGIIHLKYVNPLKLPKRKLTIPDVDMNFILGFFILDMGLIYWPYLISVKSAYVTNFFAFVTTYVHFLEFLYLTRLILNQYPEIRQQWTQASEIILINPIGSEVMGGFAYALTRGYPPSFIVLKALTPKHYKVREFHQVEWRSRYYESGKLVAITCYTTNSAEAYKIAKEYKKRGSKVVMGGPHVTYLPDEALCYCDSVVIGDAEGVWPQIVQDYENNTLKSKYQGEATQEAYDRVYEELLQSSPEAIKCFLETSHGCKFKCSFCTIPGLSGGKVTINPTDRLVTLLKKVKGKYSNVTFIDNNIYNNPVYARELFEALKPLKIKWRSSCTVDIAKNEELLKLAKESGCDLLLIGYEIISGSEEQKQRGKFGMAEQYMRFAKKFQDIGIKTRANFIFGFDSDDAGHLFRIWKFAVRMMPHTSGLALLTPLPGSQLFRNMLEANRMTNLNWKHYTCINLVFQQKKIDNFFFQHCFPGMSLMFLLTTNRVGLIMLLMIVGIIMFVQLTHV
jgi:radical SAM superfamily enzyme YgiQ (UPF0313 family)